MGAREEILTKVRMALADVPATPVEQDSPVTWEYGRSTPMPDVIERFVERVEDYRAQVVRVDGEAAVADAITAALQQHGVESVVVPANSPQAWEAAVSAAAATVLRDEPPLSNAQLDAAGAVITGCAVAAAESGTIMLDHGDGQGRRALSLVPDVHVCVVRTDQVVSDVPEAVERLHDAVAAHQPITWISGGSATSDIELSRVEGVHGPRTLVVVVVG